MSSTSFINLLLGVFFIISVGFSILLNTIFLRFAKTLGIRDKNANAIRWSPTYKPAFGGIGFFIIFLLSIIAFSIFFDANTVFHNKIIIGIIAGTSLAFLMGLADDAYNTRPFLKLSIQILCGVIVIATDNFIHLTGILYLDYGLTIIWVVGIMNSINMLDNMDAVASLVALLILANAVLSLLASNTIPSCTIMMVIGVMAALLGFLFFNWHPSKMFMGDTGSQFLGFFLAAIGIPLFWNFNGTHLTFTPIQHVVVVVMAFLPTICDTTVVSINRLARKQSPMLGGKDHVSHHLSYLGLSDRQIAMIFTGLGAISLFFSFFIYFYITEWNMLYTIIFISYFVVILATMFAVTMFHHNKR